MAVINKLPLPDSFGHEAQRLRELSELGSRRTSTGNTVFTSETSSNTYNTATYGGGVYANTGQNGILNILRIVLDDYLLDGDWVDSIEDTVAGKADSADLTTLEGVVASANASITTSLNSNFYDDYALKLTLYYQGLLGGAVTAGMVGSVFDGFLDNSSINLINTNMDLGELFLEGYRSNIVSTNNILYGQSGSFVDVFSNGTNSTLDLADYAFSDSNGAYETIQNPENMFDDSLVSYTNFTRTRTNYWSYSIVNLKSETYIKRVSVRFAFTGGTGTTPSWASLFYREPTGEAREISGTRVPVVLGAEETIDITLASPVLCTSLYLGFYRGGSNTDTQIWRIHNFEAYTPTGTSVSVFESVNTSLPLNLNKARLHLSSNINYPILTKISNDNSLFTEGVLVGARVDPLYPWFSEKTYEFELPSEGNQVKLRVEIDTSGQTTSYPIIKRYGLYWS